jgi:amino acid adenylation domain-containing protein
VAEALQAEMKGRPDLIVLDTSQPLALEGWLASEPAHGGAAVDPSTDEADLAYILYTSGSTGRPKGVALTHGNALSFVDWCSDVFAPTSDDVFSSHAPFHFDLSILDVYVPIKHGARLVLVGEQAGKEPLGLAQMIAEAGITVWYSTPSILNLLASFGHLERHDFGALRTVLFAGEVFPPAQLAALKRFWPEPRYCNLYGPTETNVCTWFEIPAAVDPNDDPYPIGSVCPPNAAIVVDSSGARVAAGEEGELLVHGPNVMTGYWNRPEDNARAFLTDEQGRKWYRTGDIVVEHEGVFHFRGRRDRMVKRRGYRVELGEIEAALARHPRVLECAVVARPDDALGVRITAFLNRGDAARLSIIELKQHCSAQLPVYMVPDDFCQIELLPRTSTDKIDYQSLLAMP